MGPPREPHCCCYRRRWPLRQRHRASPLWLDAQTLCQQQGQASASSPELRSDAYADQCMIAPRPKSPRAMIPGAGGPPISRTNPSRPRR